MKEKNNLTKWESATAKFQSQYGHVNYRQWCNKEVERFKSKGIRCEVKQIGMMIALVRV